MTTNLSDTHARLVATLALIDGSSLLDMSRHFRDLSTQLKHEQTCKPPCQFCDANQFCWWHATPEQRAQAKAKETESAHETLREAVEKLTVVPSLKPADAATCVKIAQQVWDKGASKAAAVAAARRYAHSVRTKDNGPEYA